MFPRFLSELRQVLTMPLSERLWEEVALFWLDTSRTYLGHMGTAGLEPD